MRRQGNMSQTKEQDKTSGKELNKTEISNLPDKESRAGTFLVVQRLGLHAPDVGARFPSLVR